MNDETKPKLVCVVCQAHVCIEDGLEATAQRSLRSMSFGPSAEYSTLHIVAGVCNEHADMPAQEWRRVVYNTVFQLRELDSALQLAGRVE